MPRKLSKKRVQMNNTKGVAKSYRNTKSRKLKRGGAGADAAPPPAVAGNLGADAGEGGAEAGVEGGANAAPPPASRPVAVVGAPVPVEVEGEGRATPPTLPAGAVKQRPAKASRSFTSRIFGNPKTPEKNLEKAINLIYQVHEEGFPNTLVLIKEAMQAMPGVELEEPTKTQYETLKQKYPGILRDEGGGEEDEDEGGGVDVDVDEGTAV